MPARGTRVASVTGVVILALLSACSAGPSASEPTVAAPLSSQAPAVQPTTSAAAPTTPATLPLSVAFRPPGCPISPAQASTLMGELMVVDSGGTDGGECTFKAQEGGDYLTLQWTDTATEASNAADLESERAAAPGSFDATGLGQGAVEFQGLSTDGQFQDILYWELSHRVVDLIVQMPPSRQADAIRAGQGFARSLV